MREWDPLDPVAKAKSPERADQMRKVQLNIWIGTFAGGALDTGKSNEIR